MDSAAFRKALLAYREQSKKHLEEGRRLSSMIEDDELRGEVEKPFLLKMVFEKYLDLLDERLIPALQLNDGSNGPPSPAAEPVEKAAPSPASQSPRTIQPPPVRPQADVAAPVSTHPVTHDEPPVRRPVQLTFEQHEDANGHGEPPGDEADDRASRRIIPRYTRRLPVRYCVLGRDKTMQRAFSQDVGAHGLFIASHRPEKVGNNLDIEIEVPELGKVKMQATVAWTKWVPQSLRAVDCSGFGVRISNASESWYRYFMDLEQSGAQPID